MKLLIVYSIALFSLIFAQGCGKVTTTEITCSGNGLNYILYKASDGLDSGSCSSGSTVTNFSYVYPGEAATYQDECVISPSSASVPATYIIRYNNSKATATDSNGNVTTLSCGQ
jgi:hypothetical protein